MKTYAIVLCFLLAAFLPIRLVAQDATPLKFHKPRLVKKTAKFEKSVDEFVVNDSGGVVFFFRLIGKPKKNMWLTKSNKYEVLPDNLGVFKGSAFRGDGRLLAHEYEGKMVVFDVPNKKTIVEGSKQTQGGFNQCVFVDKALVFGVDYGEKFFKWDLKNDKYTKLGEIPKEQRAISESYSFAKDFSRVIRVDSKNCFTHVDLKNGEVKKFTEFEGDSYSDNGASASENLAIVTKSSDLTFYDFTTKKSQEFKPKQPMSFSDVLVNAEGTVAAITTNILRSRETGYSIFDLRSRPCKMTGFVPSDSTLMFDNVALSSNGKFLVHANVGKNQLLLWQLAK